MKRVIKSVVLLLVLLAAIAFVALPGLLLVHGAEPSAVGVPADLPASAGPIGDMSFWVPLISVATPIVIAAIKWLVPRIPKPAIPFITPFVGLLLNVLLALAGYSGISPAQAALAGAAGVAVREFFNQLQKAVPPPDMGVNGGSGRVLAVLLLLGGTLTGGCVSYRHERFDPESGKPVELTSMRSPWLTKTAIEGLKARTTEKRGSNSYSRSIGLDNAHSETDVEGVKALESLIGSSLLRALQTPMPVK